MDRRSFITGLAAGTAALAHTGLAQASTSEAFSKKTNLPSKAALSVNTPSPSLSLSLFPSLSLSLSLFP